MADRTVRVRLDAAVAGFTSAMAQASATTRAFGNRFGRMARENQQMMRTMGTVAIAAGGSILFGLGKAASAAADFEADMNRVGALTGAVGDSFDKLGDQAQELGRTTRFSASEAAQGMGFLAMAGFETNEILTAMPSTLDLAAAGQLELAQAADIASNVLTGYGKEASQIAEVNDVIAATATNANTSVDQMGQAMSMVAPIANSSGLAFEETAAAIGMLGDAGIQGTRAGTTLRQMLASLESPTGPAADAIERLGLETHDASGSLLSMAEIIGQLEEQGASTGDVMEIFGNRAGPGLAAMMQQGSESLREMTSQLEDSGGAAQEMAERQMEGLSGAMTELGSATEGMMIAFGQHLTPVLESAADSLNGLVTGLAEMPDPVQKATVGIAGIGGVAATAAGGFLLMAPRIVATKDAMASLSTQMPRTVGAMRGLGRFLTGPWGIALAGATVAVGAFAAEKNKARQRVERFTAAIEADSGALEENTRQSVANELEKKGLLEQAREFGISLSTVTEAVLGDAEAQREVAAATAEAREEIERFRGSAKFQSERTQVAEFERQINGMTREVAAGADASERLNAAMENFDVVDAIDKGFMGFRGTLTVGNDAMDDFTASSEDAIEVVNSLDDTLETLGLVDVAAEWQSVAESFLDVNQALERSRDENRAAAEEAAEKHNAAIQSQIDALERGSTEQRRELEGQKKTWEDFAKETVSLEQVTGHLEDVNQEFRDWQEDIETIADEAGGGVAERLALLGPEWAPIVSQAVDASAEEVARLDEALADNVDLQMAAAKMAVQMEVMQEVVRQGAGATVQSVSDELGVVPDVVREVFDAIEPPQIDVDVDPAIRQINGILERIGAIPDQKIVEVSVRHGAGALPLGGRATFEHEGGLVGHGARSMPFLPLGRLKADEVPIIAQRGEEVLTPDDPRHAANAPVAVSVGAQDGRHAVSATAGGSETNYNFYTEPSDEGLHKVRVAEARRRHRDLMYG